MTTRSIRAVETYSKACSPLCAGDGRMAGHLQGRLHQTADLVVIVDHQNDRHDGYALPVSTCCTVLSSCATAKGFGSVACAPNALAALKTSKSYPPE